MFEVNWTKSIIPSDELKVEWITRLKKLNFKENKIVYHLFPLREF